MKAFSKALKPVYLYLFSLFVSADNDVPYADEGSYQKIACDLKLDPNAGSNEVGDTDYLAPIMGNVLLRDDLDAYEDTFVTTHASELFTVAPAHGFSTGDGPFEFVAGSGVLPTGISEGTLYWLIVTSSVAFKVAATKEDALAGTAVTISDDGTVDAGRLIKRVTTRLPKDSNYVAGVIAKYSIPGTVDSSYPCAALVAEVGEDVGDGKPDAVCAVVGGDGAAVTPRAMFGVRKLNSNASSDPDYGVDLQDDLAVGLSYQALAYAKAPLRLVSDVVVLVGAGVPSSGASGTGDDVAGKGSLYVDITNGKLYINGGVITSPDWKLVTSA